MSLAIKHSESQWSPKKAEKKINLFTANHSSATGMKDARSLHLGPAEENLPGGVATVHDYMSVQSRDLKSDSSSRNATPSNISISKTEMLKL